MTEKSKKELIDKALEFEKRKLSSLTTSDRIIIGREAKDLILSLNEIYKETKETEIMDIMKRLTAIKQKVEKRLNITPTA